MTLLQQTVEVVNQWAPDREDDRRQCVALLDQVVRNLEAAIEVWKAVRAEAPDVSDPLTALLSIGSARSKRLYEIYMDEKEVAEELTKLTGVPVKDTLGLTEELDIIQAYGQLQPGQTVGEKADRAIRVMNVRKESVIRATAGLK